MYKYSYYRKTIKEEHKAILGLTEFKLSLKDIEYIRKNYKENIDMVNDFKKQYPKIKTEILKINDNVSFFFYHKTVFLQL